MRERLLNPVRFLLKILLAPFRRILRFIFGVGGRTVRKTSAGAVAQRIKETPPEEKRKPDKDPDADAAGPEDDPTFSQHASRGFLFTRLERPSLVERVASDLMIEEAREYVAQADTFYTYGFPLFPRADQFYEEVEQDYLGVVLGRQNGGTDANFLDIMRKFRRSLNSNTARLYLAFTPALLAICLALAILGESLVVYVPGAAGINEQVHLALPLVAVVVVGFVAMLILYHWPYKITQQQNLLGLDNYVTSKFSRINQKFQVAKRRAMSVERTKRMHEMDDLKEEAGTWTTAYHWLAMRLYFCETCVRNAVYQIRRNTVLYAFGGVIICLLIGLGAAVAVKLTAPTLVNPPWIVAASLVFTIGAYAVIMGRATADTLSVLEPREWNRFHLIDLHVTMREHVGEDKQQIVTFRDRNRME